MSELLVVFPVAAPVALLPPCDHDSGALNVLASHGTASAAAHAAPYGDGTRVPAVGRVIRRPVLPRCPDDRHLLPAVVPREEAPNRERRVLRFAQGRCLCRLPALPQMQACGRR